MRFELKILDGITKVASVKGRANLDAADLSVSDMQKVIETEQFLERLLGFRFHITQAR